MSIDPGGHKSTILWLVSIIASFISSLVFAYSASQGRGSDRVDDRLVTQIERTARLEATVAAQGARLEQIDAQLGNIDKKIDRLLSRDGGK